jgi:hypothetical protein
MPKRGPPHFFLDDAPYLKPEDVQGMEVKLRKPVADLEGLEVAAMYLRDAELRIAAGHVEDAIQEIEHLRAQLAEASRISANNDWAKDVTGDPLEILEGFEGAYAVKIFRPFTEDELQLVQSAWPGLTDRMWAAAGRHFWPFMQRGIEEIKRLRAALERHGQITDELLTSTERRAITDELKT